MPLIQFVISYDDLLNNANESTNGFTTVPITAGATSVNNPGTINRQVNLYGGRYKCRIDGFQISSGSANTTTYITNPQIVYLSSSLFHFPAMGSGELAFTNDSLSVLSDISAHREFEINAINGNIDLTVRIAQFGQAVNANPSTVVAPYTIDKTATWASAQFAYIILSIMVEQVDSKACFGTIKGAFAQ